MSTKALIRIKGLAVCFYRDDLWNVVFVCDDVHPLKFYFPENGGVSSEDLHEIGKDLEISIDGISHKKPPVAFGPDSWRIFNMAGRYAHGPDRLKIKRRRVATDVLWMKVPNSIFDIDKITPNNYFVQEQKYPGAPVEIIGQVGSIVTLTVEVEDQITIEIKDPNDAHVSKKFSFQVPSTGIELTFDNDCFNRCTHNDFLDLYEFLIDEENGTERKFAAGQIKNPIFGSVTSPVSSGEEMVIMSAEQGNCDPVGIDPPPAEF